MKKNKTKFYDIIKKGCFNIALAQNLNPLKAQTLGQLIENMADILVKIGLPLVALFIILSGYLFVTAGGNEEKLKSAKTTFVWTIVGAIILLGAKVIASAFVELVKGL